MKRKDTKKYQTLVENYVETRRSCENRQKEIDECKHNLDEDEHNMSIATVVLGNCEDLIEWIKGLVENKVGMTKTLIEVKEAILRSEREEMEKYASILVSEYEENLDELYASNR